jgi:PucR family transcriptional regulator, purine catabolism regulatory protein
MGAGSVSVGAVAPGLASLVERLRRVHQLMVDAALTGDGLERVAELAAVEVGRPVAIVLPELAVSVVWPAAAPKARAALEHYATNGVEGGRASIPESVELAVPVTYGSRLVGTVGMLEGDGEFPHEASEFLHLAATASATAVALEQAREREEAAPEVALFEGLVKGTIEPDRAAAIAIERCPELGGGFAVVATAVRSTRPREALALSAEVAPGSLAELAGERMYIAVPVPPAGDARKAPAAAAERLHAHGPTVVTSFYRGPREVQRAAREADLMLDFAERDGVEAVNGGAGSDVYRLLFRVLASHPEEVHGFFEDTIAPVARYDDQYRGELLPTLECYLANDCNMNAAARALYAHRHTIAYRLERVRELTGLDPASTEDRERLGLGLKALRLIEAM